MNPIPTLKHLAVYSNNRKGECRCTDKKMCKGCKDFYNWAYGPSNRL